MRDLLIILSVFLLSCQHPPDVGILATNIGGGVDFDGVDDGIQEASATPDITTSISVSLWVYFNGTSGANQTLFNRQSLDDKPNFVARLTNGDALAMLWRDASDNSFDFFFTDGTWTLATGQWYHIVWTHRWGTSDSTEIYVDGVQQTLTCTRCTEENPYTAGTQKLKIGSETDGSNFSDARIKDVWLWEGHCLTQAEVDLIFDSKLKGFEGTIQSDNLYGGWILDECADGTSCDGASFTDRTGNGNTLLGADGANNTGLDGLAETDHTYWGF